MTVVDHPLRLAAELNARIAEELHTRPCWKVSLVLGSMFVVDFGGRRNLMGRGGREIEIGDVTLSVRDVLWFVERDGKVVHTSDGVSPESVAALESTFVGRTLQRMDWGAYASLVFSDGVVVRCDRTDAYDNDGDELVEFRFMNDDYVDCYASGQINTERAPS